MSFADMSPRDRRALVLGGAVLVPALLFALVVRPLAGSLGEVRERTRMERELLAREMGLLRQAGEFPARLDSARAALRAEAPRLFRGVDGLAAASALENYVGEKAEASRVLVRRSESREGGAEGSGLLSLQVDLQGEGDLQALLTLLRGLDTGTRLVRVDRLSVERREAAGPETAPLSFTLTVVGYTLGVPSSAADSTASSDDSADSEDASESETGEGR
ncbi:MAG TPA: type II secretion system protein GspM [Longimicrobium sp.]|nr:type II secretion system protein GspM [Longimicrobium sp.]